MRRVSLREANQNFSSCIAEVEEGERLIIERRGKPVAEIIPYRKPARDSKREAALKRLRESMSKGFDLTGVYIRDRDEFYADRG